MKNESLCISRFYLQEKLIIIPTPHIFYSVNIILQAVQFVNPTQAIPPNRTHKKLTAGVGKLPAAIQNLRYPKALYPVTTTVLLKHYGFGDILFASQSPQSEYCSTQISLRSSKARL